MVNIKNRRPSGRLFLWWKDTNPSNGVWETLLPVFCSYKIFVWLLNFELVASDRIAATTIALPI